MTVQFYLRENGEERINGAQEEQMKRKEKSNQMKTNKWLVSLSGELR